MRFIVRNVEESDLSHLYRLAKQTSLVHLPSDKAFLKEIIEKSAASFSNNIPPEDAIYVFVLEDLHRGEVVGTSQVIANYATKEDPHYCYEVLEREHADEELNIKMNHQVLRLKKTIRGISAIGGVVLDSRYRELPEKLGRQIILTRFIYMGMFQERFGEQILSELMAPVTENGVNLFWESLGKRFTGLAYEDFLSLLGRRNNNFIENLFPKEDIYLSLTDNDIRFSRDRVEPKYGKSAKRIIQSMGLRYLNRVDFDGGLLYGAPLREVSVVRKGAFYKVEQAEPQVMNRMALMGVARDGQFRGGAFPCLAESQTAFLAEPVLSLLNLSRGDDIYLSPLD